MSLVVIGSYSHQVKSTPRGWKGVVCSMDVGGCCWLSLDVVCSTDASGYCWLSLDVIGSHSFAASDVHWKMQSFGKFHSFAHECR